MTKKIKIRNSVLKTFNGNDGIVYRGKAAKKRKKLEARILDYEATIKRNSDNPDAFIKPGKM